MDGLPFFLMFMVTRKPLRRFSVFCEDVDRIILLGDL